MELLLIVALLCAILILLILKSGGKHTSQPTSSYESRVSHPIELSLSQQKYVKRWAASPNKARIFGLPGYGLTEEFGIQGKLGMNGEIEIASILNGLAKAYPELNIYHGVHLYNQDWDIDHVISYGDTLIVIDTKTWANNHTYTISKDEDFGKLVVLRDNQYFGGSLISMPLTVKSLKEQFPYHKVFAVIAVNINYGNVVEDLARTKCGFVKKSALLNRIENLLKKSDIFSTPPNFEDYCLDLHLLAETETT